jgi:NAD(P)-dependent dehydrogenase (short-subunit alcohol dehydrogenase family)
MSLDFGLKDVHVLITGAAASNEGFCAYTNVADMKMQGGIGLETVKTFKQLGARITAHYNSNIGELANPQDIVALQADVRDEASVGNLIPEATEKNGGPVSTSCESWYMVRILFLSNLGLY